MPKFSRPSSKPKISTRLAICAILACLVVGLDGHAVWANSFVEDKGDTETFDLTAVPSINKDPAASTRDASATKSAETNHAPYLMLSAPPGSKTSSTQSKSKATPLKWKNKTPEYDLKISDFEATTSTVPAPKKNIFSRAVGVTCGVCVGVPVSIARDTRKYTGQMKKSMNDGIGVEKGPDLVGNMMAGACAVPFGIGSGLVHGSVTGFQRAVEHGKTQPFSKKSMSLGAQEKSLSNRPDDIGNN